MDLHVTNDLAEPWEGMEYRSLEKLDGEVVEAGQEAISAAPLASTHVCMLDFSGCISDENSREVILVCELLRGDQRVTLNLATFVPSKHLSLTSPTLQTSVQQDGNELVFKLTSESVARFVELSFEGVDVVFSDNYFDLPAGRTMEVISPLPEGWTVDQARKALRVRSLYDSFAL